MEIGKIFFPLLNVRILNNRLKYFFPVRISRFAEVRNTLQGKLEERLPFFSFIFPDAFKQRYSKEYAQFKNNLHRLSTPFDVHETFMDLLRKFSK